MSRTFNGTTKSITCSQEGQPQFPCRKYGGTSAPFGHEDETPNTQIKLL